MARIMPKRGFYVFNGDNPRTGAIFSSGEKTGNAYYDPVNHSDKWNKLLWTCVPGQKELDKSYTYFPENPTGKQF